MFGFDKTLTHYQCMIIFFCFVLDSRLSSYFTLLIFFLGLYNFGLLLPSEKENTVYLFKA